MTVDGSDERPLALRDLAQADSPELVRAALGRFRRRLLVRGLILVLIAAIGLFLYPRYFRSAGDLSSEIAHGRGVAVYNTVKAGTTEATIFRVARLSRERLTGEAGEGFGIHLVVTINPPEPAEEIVSLLRSDLGSSVLFVRTDSSSSIATGFEMWIMVVAGTPTIDIPVAHVASATGSAKVISPSLDTLHIDMRELAVPDWTWR
jgi:hypothetical protein